LLCLTYISSHLILVSAHNGDEPPKDPIKVFQCSLVKQQTQGSTWDCFIMTYVPAEHRQNTGYIFLEKYICILSKNNLYSRISKVYTTEIHSNIFLA